MSLGGATIVVGMNGQSTLVGTSYGADVIGYTCDSFDSAGFCYLNGKTRAILWRTKQ